jgi:putative redox protein
MADAAVVLKWAGSGLVFDGGADGGPQVRLDGDGIVGTSPMTTLLLALAGCMSADMVDIATKMRVQFDGLTTVVEADRAPAPPRRYTRIAMRFRVSGASAADEPKLQRALDMSRETYCSVLHTLRQDAEYDFQLELP